MSITVYTTPTCPYCRQAKEYLKMRQSPFTEKNVATDQGAADEMVRLSGQRGVPVLVINGEVIIGFDRPRIDEALAGGGSTQLKLGAAVADAEKMAPKYGLGIYEGAYVGRVNPGSVSERAGITAGDIITHLAGQPVKMADDIQQIIGGLRAGQRVLGVVWRDGRQIQLEMTF